MTPADQKALIRGVLILAGLIFVGWFIFVSSSSTPTAEDSVGRHACEDFHSMAHDASEGILSQSEVREKMQGIYGTAQYADTASIRTSAQEMLSVITQEGYNSPNLPGAIDDMGHACESIGA